MNIGSLCSGYGGLDMAVEWVTGAHVEWVAEYDKHASTILNKHYNVTNYGDITAVNWTELPAVDWITAGYPCQPFSHAGKRQGTNDDRHIWPHIKDAIRTLRPAHVLLENVAGHLSLGFGRVLGDLAEIGYDAQWVSVRASDVGAPHHRLRVFILANPHGGAHSQLRRTGRGVANESTQVGERRIPRQSRTELGNSDQDVANSASLRSQRRIEPLTDNGKTDTAGTSHFDGSGGHDITWGPYAPAISQWEHRIGRSAPAATDEHGRLSATFMEWLMGLQPGWVTETGIPRTAQLKALGNGFVPQQAAYALTRLLEAA